MEIVGDFRGLDERFPLYRDRFDTFGMEERRQIACSRRKEMCEMLEACGMEIAEDFRGLDECSPLCHDRFDTCGMEGRCKLRVVVV